MLRLVSCECDACTALNARAQLQDKRVESGQHVGSNLISGGVSTCKFIGATILLWLLSEFYSLGSVFPRSYPKRSQSVSQSIHLAAFLMSVEIQLLFCCFCSMYKMQIVCKLKGTSQKEEAIFFAGFGRDLVCNTSSILQIK